MKLKWLRPNKSLKDITLDNMVVKMKEEGFSQELIEEISGLFKGRIKKKGELEFQEYMGNLHFNLPEEFNDEELSISFYEKYVQWVEEEINKLELETELSWEEQSEDLNQLDSRARKFQLVIRHRLSEVVISIEDQ